MAFAGVCPYLKNIKDANTTVCECARFTFPDREAKRDVLYRYCGHTDAWKECPFKMVMDKYYDRKYSADGEPSVVRKTKKRGRRTAVTVVKKVDFL